MYNKRTNIYPNPNYISYYNLINIIQLYTKFVRLVD